MTPPAGRLLGPLTSVPLAVVLFGLLAILACLRGGHGSAPALAVLVLVLCAAALAVSWIRRPYDRARAGFLLVHIAPVFIVLGLLGQRWAAGLGMACLALGLPWMFYLKPLLKAKKAGPPAPAWQRGTLQGTRVLFLGTGALLAGPLLRGQAPAPWLPVAWLLLAAALHVHHLKGWKGSRAQGAGLVAWGLGLAAYLGLR